MKKTAKKSLLITLLIGLFGLMLAACGGTSSNKAAPSNSGAETAQVSGTNKADSGSKKITILYIGDQFWLDQAKAFEAKTGIKVNYVTIPFGQIHDTLVTAFAGGSSDYDIIHVHDGFVSEFAPKGFLTPLDDMITQDMKSQVDPNVFKPLTYNGKMYGVPRYIWPWQFYYNKKMFEDAGIAQPPQTWDEFVQDALKLKEKGMQYPYAEIMSEKSSYIPFVIQLRARGGEFWDYQKGVPIFNSPEGVSALKFLADLNLKYKVMSPQSFEYADTLKSMESFRQGNTALLLSTPQTFGQANDPKLSKIVGQAAVSIIPGDKLKTASYAETGGIAIPSSSKNKEAAFEFIKFATSAEQEKAMALGAGRIPVNKEALADMEVQKKNPHFTPIAVQLQYPYGIFKHERATEISDVVSQHVTAAVAGRETPEQALKAAEADALRIAGK